jgi:response regulator RpfG family c-di-GMP phosphodiesterase
MVLRDCPDTRIRQFETVSALKIYLGIAPIHLLICDYQLNDWSCAHLIASLKSDPKMHTENMQTMVLTKDIDKKVQQEITIAGIDEILVKPMSPQYVFERAQARLALPARYKRVPARTTSLVQRIDALIEPDNFPEYDAPNVVPLFKSREIMRQPEKV